MIYDIAIIGAGTAGMTAALYALRANKTVLLLESTIFGGQIIQSPLIENYPALPNISGQEFATHLHQQLHDLGFSITYQTVQELNLQDSIYQIYTKNQIYQAKTVILATGTTRRKLNLPEEDQLLGKGIAICATCDGPLYKNKDVAVVGGGNSAVLSALYLADLCQNVYLIHRSDTFRTEDLLFHKLKSRTNVIIITNTEVKSFQIADNHLKGLILTKNLDASLRQDPSKPNLLSVSGLFIEIGRIFPSLHLLQNFITNQQLATDESGFPITDDNCSTNLPGFFVAGDCRSKNTRQLVTAAADGALSATSAINFLN